MKVEVRISMDTSVFVAVITASGSILAGSLTFYLTKRHQWKVEWQHEKLNHYKVLLSSLSDLAVGGTDREESHQRFALASNTIALVAPQYVITALMDLHDEVKYSNPNKSPERSDELLKKLLLAIRKDIGLSKKDRENQFVFHLIGFAPR